MLYTKGLRLHAMTASEYRASLWPPFAASTIIEPDLRVKGPNSSQGNHRLLIQSATLHGIHTYIHKYTCQGGRRRPGCRRQHIAARTVPTATIPWHSHLLALRELIEFLAPVPQIELTNVHKGVRTPPWLRWIHVREDGAGKVGRRPSRCRHGSERMRGLCKQLQASKTSLST